MRKSNRSRQSQGWLGARRVTAFTVTAILLTACFAHPVVAGEPDEQISSTSSVASNKQIELGAGSTGSGDDVPPVRRTADEVLEKSDRDGAVPGSSVMRRRASLERTTPFDAPTRPWYRSGLVALMIVLGIVWLAYWAVRRWMPTARISAGSRALLTKSRRQRGHPGQKQVGNPRPSRHRRASDRPLSGVSSETPGPALRR